MTVVADPSDGWRLQKSYHSDCPDAMARVAEYEAGEKSEPGSYLTT